MKKKRKAGIGWKSKPALVLLLLIHALALPAAAGEAALTRYVAVPASADGIGKVYQGREISHVMGYHGAQWLERTERADEEIGRASCRERV